MFRHARTAVKWLVYGLVVGLLFAPASGKETRKDLLHWGSEALKDATKMATGGKLG